MTSPAVQEQPKHAQFHARYKEPHPLAGCEVQRGRECGCGRWFPQWAISRHYLAERPGARASFLESCETEKLSKGEIHWHPKRCHRCERRLNDVPQL